MTNSPPLDNHSEICSDATPIVLVVDDSPENREYICRLLRKVDAKVIEAGSGNEALDAFESHNSTEFALILMDVNMPGMDGYEAVTFIKNRIGENEIPIIFVTSQADYDHENWGYDSGAVDYLIRPINTHALMSKVKVFLELFNQRRQLEFEIAERERMEAERIQREKQLWQSQKMESLGTMAGGIAHEFNNIFSSMLGHTELLRQRLKSGEQEAIHIDRIGTGLNKATQLVKHMTSFSQFGEFDPEPASADNILHETFELLRTILPSSVLLEKNLKSDGGCICVDKSGLFQVIMNIGSNAVEAMDNQRGTLELHAKKVTVNDETIQLQPHLTEGEYLKITFKDNGCGMENEVLDKVFDPFFTSKRSQSNAGLGMSVAHGILMEHQGDIQIHSRPGIGTEVSIWLPITSNDLLQNEDLIPSEPEEPQKESSTKRILLVDDNTMTLEAAHLILEALNHEVTEKENGIEALEAFSASPESFDLIITDQIMPHMNGVELVARIREMNSDIPIILCSGYSEIVNRDNHKEHKIDGFLSKPFSIQEMSTIVQETLNQTR